jgi:tetratricopeptide (TPR) repeat protein
MEAHLIHFKGRSWLEIEQSVAQLSLLDPQLVISDDIFNHLPSAHFPSEINSLIADYASFTGPLDRERNAVIQLRIYALHKCGRIKSALYCVSSLHFGFVDEDVNWINKMALDLYGEGRYDEAYAAWICAYRRSDGAFIHGSDGVMAHALTGNFAQSLALTNVMAHCSWTQWVRGQAFAGLRMYDDAVEELTKCIKQSSCAYVTMQAVELKNAIEIRAANEKKGSPWMDEIKTLEWIREAHRIAAIKQPYDYLTESDLRFPIPDSLFCFCMPIETPATPKTRKRKSLSRVSQTLGLSCRPVRRCRLR